jgi:large subunit ribosomal protein L25
MQLAASKRAMKTKREKKRLRRDRKIPAIVYGKGKAVPISVDASEFEAILRKVPKGELSTVKFSLSVEDEKIEALVKDIEYDKTSYQIIHLDFLQLDKETPVVVSIPLRFSGQMECPGLKLGGVLRKVMRDVKVQCLPKNMPSHFDLNVAELSVGQSKRVKDIQFDGSLRMITKTDEVVVVIAKR